MLAVSRLYTYRHCTVDSDDRGQKNRNRFVINISLCMPNNSCLWSSNKTNRH